MIDAHYHLPESTDVRPMEYCVKKAPEVILLISFQVIANVEVVLFQKKIGRIHQC